MTMIEIDAALVAQRVLWSQWGIRDEIEGKLPPSRIDLNPGDLIKTTVDGVEELIRVDKVSRGLNYNIEFTGRVEEPDIFVQSVVESPRSCNPPDDPFNGSNAVLEMFISDQWIVPMSTTPSSTGLLDTEGDQNAVFYAWRDNRIGGGSPDSARAILWQAPLIDDPNNPGTDIPGTFGTNDIYNGNHYQAKMATVSTALPAPNTNSLGGLYVDIDASFEMTVSDNSWTPNATEPIENVLNGTNIILIQGGDPSVSGSPEMLGFLNAELVTGDGINVPKLYRLSGLLRGLRGTQRNAQAWPIGSVVLSADSFLVPGASDPRVASIDSHPSSLTERQYMKIVPSGTVAATPQEWQVDITHGTSAPFPMDDGRKIVTAAGDATILYRRNTRAFAPGIFLGRSVPGAGDSQIYQLDILDNVDQSTVKRTIQTAISFLDIWYLENQGHEYPVFDGVRLDLVMSGLVPFDYPIADQITDGYAANDPIHCVAYQLGHAPLYTRSWPSPVQVV